MSAALMSHQPPPARLRLRGHHVLLRADGLRLLLPQRDVGVARTLEVRPRPGTARGRFVIGEEAAQAPVVALSARLRCLDTFPADRFVLVQLVGETTGTWFAWNEVRVLIDADLECQPLPPVLRYPGAPLAQVVPLGENLAFVTQGERLLAYVR